MRATSRLGWIVAIGGVLLCTAARADVIDPTTLHIGSGAGTPCATGGSNSCYLYNNEVNPISSPVLDIYQNQSSAGPLTNPVLLILAVPNQPAGLDMSGAITDVSLIAPYPGGTTTSGITSHFGTADYGITPPGGANASTGFAGTMTSGQDVYTLLGGDAAGAGSSNSFTNYAAADSAVLGINATSFGIYVYELETGDFAGNDLLNVSLSGIPQGTFAVAFGEEPANNGNITIYDTPFTESGLVTGLIPPHPHQTVPEPSTLALFGALLLALVGVRRRFMQV